MADGHTGTVRCSRCGESRTALGNPPLAGELGARIQSAVCASCWSEWQASQINVINEHRISLRDRKGQETLIRMMKEFLKIRD